MGSAWDSFIRGFDPEQAEQPEPSLDEDPIFEQLDAVYDECTERGEPKWWPPGRDPENLERLVRERRERGVGQ